MPIERTLINPSQGLALGYAVPIAVSMIAGRHAVSGARFKFPSLVGWTVNALAVLWVAFQLVLFSMPAALPVTAVSMNYASVVLVGFMVLSTLYYVIWARKGESPYSSRYLVTSNDSCSLRRAAQIGRDVKSAISGCITQWQTGCHGFRIRFRIVRNRQYHPV